MGIGSTIAGGQASGIPGTPGFHVHATGAHLPPATNGFALFMPVWSLDGRPSLSLCSGPLASRVLRSKPRT